VTAADTEVIKSAIMAVLGVLSPLWSSRVFPHLYTLQNVIYLRFLERLVPVNIIHQFLNIFKAYYALGKVHNEIMDASHHYSW
jgi:hypothetical protein